MTCLHYLAIHGYVLKVIYPETCRRPPTTRRAITPPSAPPSAGPPRSASASAPSRASATARALPRPGIPG
eukprot:scaffold318561_cov15-Prasinocladus_malaysianus.AAC.1